MGFVLRLELRAFPRRPVHKKKRSGAVKQGRNALLSAPGALPFSREPAPPPPPPLPLGLIFPPGAPAAAAPRPRVTDSDLMVTVTIHVPESPGRPLEQFLCLGTQSLAELRDVITCDTDRIRQEIDEAVPSAYFYFEGVFFADLRREDAEDTTAGVREFLLEREARSTSFLCVYSFALAVAEVLSTHPDTAPAITSAHANSQSSISSSYLPIFSLAHECADGAAVLSAGRRGAL